MDKKKFYMTTAIAYTSGTVSYTHLDVYKRQEEWLEAGYEVHGLKYDGDGIPKLGIVKE